MIEIIIPVKAELHDWSESLTYDQLTSTAQAISMYLNDESIKENLTKKSISQIERWLKKNDITKFFREIHRMNAATDEVRLLNSLGLFDRIGKREH